MNWINRDGKLILAARGLRMFAYGFLSVLLGLYLEQAGLSPAQIGTILTAILAGSAALTTAFSIVADRYGRRRMLALSTLLMAIAGMVFAATSRYPVLLLASLSGTLGASGGDLGPFRSLEQAMLPQTAPAARRNVLFGIYNTVAAVTGALGALCAAVPTLLVRWLSLRELVAYRVMFVLFAALAMCALFLVTRLSDRVELPTQTSGEGRGLQRSKGRVFTLATLFALDSFAGGFVLQSLIAYWFHLRWGIGPGVLGPLFLAVGVVQAISYLVASRIADRIGLINTMVFTHLPSSVLLMLVPAAPTLPTAAALILARHALSQMDIPARQTYVVSIVDPGERTAAAGITEAVRNAAQALTPVLAGYTIQTVSLGVPFVIGGALKIVYDLALFILFRNVRPPEEVRGAP